MATNAEIFQFRAHFPELNGAADADIAESFNIADVWLDPTQWSVRDFALARLFWAAHYLTLKQQDLASADFAGGAGDPGLFVRSVTIGDRHISFQQKSGGRGGGASTALTASEMMLSDTKYGIFFMQLRGRNIIPVMVV